eukprot:jgi/Mesvir1/9045/Mv21327-RA.3
MWWGIRRASKSFYHFSVLADMAFHGTRHSRLEINIRGRCHRVDIICPSLASIAGPQPFPAIGRNLSPLLRSVFPFSSAAPNSSQQSSIAGLRPLTARHGQPMQPGGLVSHCYIGPMSFTSTFGGSDAIGSACPSIRSLSATRRVAGGLPFASGEHAPHWRPIRPMASGAGAGAGDTQTAGDRMRSELDELEDPGAEDREPATLPGIPRISRRPLSGMVPMARSWRPSEGLAGASTKNSIGGNNSKGGDGSSNNNQSKDGSGRSSGGEKPWTSAGSGSDPSVASGVGQTAGLGPSLERGLPRPPGGDAINLDDVDSWHLQDMLRQLSPEQLRVAGAVLRPLGAAAREPRTPLLVEGGPGTGKSLLVAAQAALAIDAKQVQPQEVLVVTSSFANAGAVHALIERLAPLDPTQGVRVLSVHSLAKWLVWDALPSLGYPGGTQVISEAEAESLAGELRVPEDWPEVVVDPRLLRRTLLRCFRELQGAGVAPEELLSYATARHLSSYDLSERSGALRMQVVARAFGEWQALKRQRGAVEWSDMLGLACALIETRRSLANKKCADLKLLLVDELQDMRPQALRLLAYLFGRVEQAVLYGDVSQQALRWQGRGNSWLPANEYLEPARSLRELLATVLPDAALRATALAQGFRCRPDILGSAQRVLDGGQTADGAPILGDGQHRRTRGRARRKAALGMPSSSAAPTPSTGADEGSHQLGAYVDSRGAGGPAVPAEVASGIDVYSDRAYSNGVYSDNMYNGMAASRDGQIDATTTLAFDTSVHLSTNRDGEENHRPSNGSAGRPGDPSVGDQRYSGAVHLILARSTEDEAARVADDIIDTCTRRGWDFSDVVVVGRAEPGGARGRSCDPFMVAAALRKRGVATNRPSDSIMLGDTPEVAATAALLAAVACPDSSRLLRRALGTPLFDLDASALDTLSKVASRLHAPFCEVVRAVAGRGAQGRRSQRRLVSDSVRSDGQGIESGAGVRARDVTREGSLPTAGGGAGSSADGSSGSGSPQWTSQGSRQGRRWEGSADQRGILQQRGEEGEQQGLGLLGGMQGGDGDELAPDELALLAQRVEALLEKEVRRRLTKSKGGAALGATTETSGAAEQRGAASSGGRRDGGGHVQAAKKSGSEAQGAALTPAFRAELGRALGLLDTYRDRVTNASISPTDFLHGVARQVLRVFQARRARQEAQRARAQGGALLAAAGGAGTARGAWEQGGGETAGDARREVWQDEGAAGPGSLMDTDDDHDNTVLPGLSPQAGGTQPSNGGHLAGGAADTSQQQQEEEEDSWHIHHGSAGGGEDEHQHAERLHKYIQLLLQGAQLLPADPPSRQHVTQHICEHALRAARHHVHGPSAQGSQGTDLGALRPGVAATCGVPSGHQGEDHHNGADMFRDPERVHTSVDQQHGAQFEDYQRTHFDDRDSAVVITSFSQLRGRQFRAVYLVGAAESYLPGRLRKPFLWAPVGHGGSLSLDSSAYGEPLGGGGAGKDPRDGARAADGETSSSLKDLLETRRRVGRPRVGGFWDDSIGPSPAEWKKWKGAHVEAMRRQIFQAMTRASDRFVFSASVAVPADASHEGEGEGEGSLPRGSLPREGAGQCVSNGRGDERRAEQLAKRLAGCRRRISRFVTDALGQHVVDAGVRELLEESTAENSGEATSHV